MWALSALRQGTRSLPSASHSQGALIGLANHLLQLSESTAPTVTVTIRSVATDNPGAEQPHASAPDFKPALLDAALKHVGTHGWSRAAVAAAARESGLSPAAAGVLEYDGELVHHFMSKCNRHLETALHAEDLEGFRIKQRVAKGVQLRLEMNIPYMDSWAQALALVAQPQALIDTIQLYGATADIIWRAAGDTSTDFNWYTKRGLLIGVYTATELYMLTDCSPGYADTWASLERRIDDVMSVGRAVSSLVAGPKGGG